MFQLGFDADAFGLVFTTDYKAKVLTGERGRVTQGTVEKFLEKVLPACSDLSFNKDKMLKEFLFTDSEITYENNNECTLYLEHSLLQGYYFGLFCLS